MGGEASSPDKKPPNGTSANPSTLPKKKPERDLPLSKEKTLVPYIFIRRVTIGTPLSLLEEALGSPDINPKETLSSPVYFSVTVPFLFLLKKSGVRTLPP